MKLFSLVRLALAAFVALLVCGPIFLRNLTLAPRGRKVASGVCFGVAGPVRFGTWPIRPARVGVQPPAPRAGRLIFA